MVVSVQERKACEVERCLYGKRVYRRGGGTVKQCKDIRTVPILEFLQRWNKAGFKGISFPGYDNSVTNAMPDGISDKLVRAKMRNLVKRGLVTGCPCGCRGDYAITDYGRDFLKLIEETVDNVFAEIRKEVERN